jgi:hypothetical protein
MLCFPFIGKMSPRVFGKQGEFYAVVTAISCRDNRE